MRKRMPGTPVAWTRRGDGSSPTSASPRAPGLFKPTGIALDRHGALLVADQGNNVIRRIARDASRELSPASPVTTIVGSGQPGFSGDGGDALAATLTIPTEVLPMARGRLLIADRGNQRVRIAVPVANGCAASCPARSRKP